MNDPFVLKRRADPVVHLAKQVADLTAELTSQRDEARAQLATLTAQRDRLLEACKAAYWLPHGVPWSDWAAVQQQLDEAIREIEGAKEQSP